MSSVIAMKSLHGFIIAFPASEGHISQPTTGFLTPQWAYYCPDNTDRVTTLIRRIHQMGKENPYIDFVSEFTKQLHGLRLETQETLKFLLVGNNQLCS